MTIGTYLTDLSQKLVLNGTEKASIDTSISAIERRVNSWFGDGVSEHFRFGSSTRGTILPRRYDYQSDIDYMIVFEDASFSHQTYLNRLRRFAEHYYSTSEVSQSFPTQKLSLSHIYFDIVPARRGNFGIQIPDKGGSWVSTYPHSFNADITAKNTEKFSLLKPAIRLIKCWNANKYHPYQSYMLEKKVAALPYTYCYNLKQMFRHLVDGLSEYDVTAEYQRAKIRTLKSRVKKAYDYEDEGYEYLPQSELEKIFD